MNDHAIPGVTKRDVVRGGDMVDIAQAVGKLVLLFLAENKLQDHQEFNVTVFKGISFSDYTPFVVDVTPIDDNVVHVDEELITLNPLRRAGTP